MMVIGNLVVTNEKASLTDIWLEWKIGGKNVRYEGGGRRGVGFREIAGNCSLFVTDLFTIALKKMEIYSHRNVAAQKKMNICILLLGSYKK